MGATYTSARQRDGQRRQPAASARGFALLLAISLVFALSSALAQIGRTRALSHDDSRLPQAPVNLSAVASPEVLEPVVALAYPQPADRRVAARELHRALTAIVADGRLSHVGVLAGIRVPVSSLERMPVGSVFAARRHDRLTQVSAQGDPSQLTVPLFTPADLAAIKPALVVRTHESQRRAVLWCSVAIVGAFLAVWFLSRRVGSRGDPVLLAAAWLLVTCGFLVMLTRQDPLRDTLLIVRYTQGVVLGLLAYLGASLVSVRRLSHVGFSYLPLVVAILLALVLAVAGSGPGASGARINLGPFQPMEVIRLLLAVFLAGYFARRWEMIRQVRTVSFGARRLPRWLDVPRPDLVMPVVAGVAAALTLFFVLRDLGPALLLSLVFLAMFAVARAKIGMAAGGLVALVAGVVLGHQLGVSSTLSARVAMWWSPWENAVRGGDQVAQALWALASGAIGGTGLGLGGSRYLPAGHTDLALAAVAEELGAVGMVVVLAAFAVIVWRGFRISRHAATDYGVFLAMAMTLSLALPALVMAAGLLGVLPLTGVVTPFISYGGSAMLANFVALGLLTACRSDAVDARPGEPFAAPSRWLLRTMAVAAAALVMVWGHVQVVSADRVLVRPQLGRQADGGIRYQYNPRVLEAMGRVQRGTVFDRAGVPLATDDPAVVEAEADVYRRLGVSIERACGTSSRCYPLGGESFHVVGDATTRANWAATNTSYVERDAAASLRGFDDRASTVRSTAAETVALRRDFTPLVPLVRHRWAPDHPEAAAVLEASRDVRLTIDARLQHRVASILARAVTAAGVDGGAAVVLDAATGEVLASVSYPWPAAGTVPSSNAALDRARYGLYPPGSTFKLVTAAAALQTDPSLADLPLVCSRLPGHRAGARLAGYGRPIRDDIRDRQPHGAIDLHDGLVRSCNAYFAQLAVRLGADVMTAVAGSAGMALSTSADPVVVGENLPHAGYGQGQVVTTPLRMARVVAAIGSDGTLRESPLVAGAAPVVETPWLNAGAAATLAGFMRDAVTSGTGRSLARHPVPIAGKTGTAEVDGAASHAWFVGFAPHGPATRRVAFAVVLEHAGYGGASAAAASGEIVTAAASLGLLK